MAERNFRDDKERRIWENLLRDLSEEASKPEDVAKVLGALTAAVGILPTDAGIKQALLNAVRRLKDDTKTAVAQSDEWNKRLDRLRQQVVDAGASVFKPTKPAKAGKEAVEEKKEEVKKKIAAKTLKASERKDEIKILRRTLGEVLEQIRSGTTDELLEARKNLVLQIVALQSKNDDKFDDLRKAFKKIDADEFIDRLYDIRQEVRDSRKEWSRRWSSVKDGISSFTRRSAMALGIGGLNLYNAYRLGKGTVGAVGSAAGLVGSGYRMARGMIDYRKAINEYSVDYDSNNTNNLADVQEDKKEKQRRDFLGMFSRQLDLVRGMKEDGDSGGGSSSMLTTALAAILGVLGLKTLSGKGMMGLVKALPKAAIGAVTAVGAMLGGMLATGAKFLLSGSKKLAFFVLRMLGRGALFGIPIIGPLLGGLLLANEFGVLDGVKAMVAPIIMPVLENVVALLTGAATWTKEKMEELYTGIKGWVDPITNSISTAFSWVHDTLYSAYKYVRDLITGYAEKWKDVPLVGNMLKNLQGFITDPTGYSASVAKGVATAVGSAASSANSYIASGAPMADMRATMGGILGRATDMFAEDRRMLGTAGAYAQSGLSKGMSLASGAFNTAGNYISESYGTLTSALGSLFTTSGRVDMDNLDPRMQQAFLGAVEEYKGRGGDKRVVVTSAYRSPEYQAELHNRNPRMAAPPGRSLHQYGLAIDADRNALNEMDQMGILAKYGLTRPIRNEPWHVQPMGISSAASTAGVYSADSPQSQGDLGFGASTKPASTSSRSPSIMFKEQAPSVTGASGSSSGQQSPVKEGASQRIDVGDIDMLSYSDAGFFALNIGILSP